MTDYGDWVDTFRKLRGDEDAIKWERGDKAVAFCKEHGIEPKAGRPPANSTTPTLADLARDSDTDSQRISECHTVSAFYGINRVSGDYATWAHHDTARKHVEKNGGDNEDAIELIKQGQKLYMNHAAFRRWLNNWVFEGEISVTDLPRWLQAMLPGDIKAVWANMRKYEEKP